YASLALFVDATAWPENCNPQTEAIRWLGEQTLSGSAFVAARLVSIDVHYGGGDGPDLESVARHSRLAPADVISRHAAARYTVAMLGFAPGFPYLIGMDPTLAVPRLATPRAHVPAGSVAIGGAQTGIYPRSGPGGWHIIGRTTLELFDPARDPPALLAPGDQVRFVPAADPR
ncbi:MAG: allophanate hydrolase subunit 1, partial [Xanthomonadaceae bacterium]|nr:allophanate hydrolase subunit 1 [Xanthomonadaceae bacterium]